MAATSNVSRRALLSTGAAAVVAASLPGCATTERAGATSRAAEDVTLVEEALQDETTFEAMCADLRRRNRRAAPQLDVVIAGQRAHIDALAATVEQPPTDSTPSIGAGLTIGTVSGEAARLHRRRLVDCQAAQAGALAQLFASIAASHAVTARYWSAP